jgi:hypothetical protein
VQSDPKLSAAFLYALACVEGREEALCPVWQQRGQDGPTDASAMPALTRYYEKVISQEYNPLVSGGYLASIE